MGRDPGEHREELVQRLLRSIDPDGPDARAHAERVADTVIRGRRAHLRLRGWFDLGGLLHDLTPRRRR